MNLKIWEVVSIFLSALVTGVFWGPWLGLSRSIKTFEAEVFLAIGHRMIRNLAPITPVLMPAAILSIVPVFVMSFHERPLAFYFPLAGFVLLIAALLVTLMLEVDGRGGGDRTHDLRLKRPKLRPTATIRYSKLQKNNPRCARRTVVLWLSCL